MTIDIARYKWLENQLDKDDLSDDDFNKFNKELNELQSKINDIKSSENLLKNEKKQALLSQCRSFCNDKEMSRLIKEYGAEFIDDYKITDENEVISSAFNEHNPNQNNSWKFSSKEDCFDKLNMLLYYRIYNKYKRGIS